MSNIILGNRNIAQNKKIEKNVFPHTTYIPWEPDRQFRQKCLS